MSSLRDLERDSIRAFVESCAEHFAGKRVLDLGCGLFPYREIIMDAGGDYFGWDRTNAPGHVAGMDPACVYYNWRPWGDPRGPWDTLLTTQTAQYVNDVPSWLAEDVRPLLRPGGVLVMTYVTNWPEVEEDDLHRHTKAGMTQFLADDCFTIERHERRAEIVWNGETFALGYGVVARAA